MLNTRKNILIFFKSALSVLAIIPSGRYSINQIELKQINEVIKLKKGGSKYE